MNWLLIVIWTLFLPISTQFAQNTNSNHRATIRVVPSFSSWSTGEKDNVTQTSTEVWAYLHPIDNLSVSLNTQYAQNSGFSTDIGGFTDSKIGSSYYLEDLGLILSLNVNVPTGKTRLSTEEVAAAATLSNYVFGFKAPGLGQGFNMAPGLTWTRALGEKLAIGSGFSFQHLGRFEPIEGGGDFNPGDQTLWTVGCDYRISLRTTVSADVVLVHSMTDRYADEAFFSAGLRTSTSVQLEHFIRHHRLRFYSQFRTQDENRFLVTNTSVEPMPSNVTVGTDVKLKTAQRIYISAHIQARFYEQNLREFSGGSQTEIGLIFDYAPSSALKLPLFASYSTGSLQDSMNVTGFSAGVGLVYSF